jgi:DNA gyrase subunit A
LLFFTNRGRVFRLKAHEVPVASLASKGVAAVNLLQLQPEEKITSIIRQAKSDGEDGHLFMTTTKGTIKKTPFKEYTSIRTNGLIAIKLGDGDELRWIKRTSGENDIIISTSAGQAVRFNESDVRPMGRSAVGVRGARLRPNDRVVGMDVINDNNATLLVVSEKGYGKITKVSNFPCHKRGGVGIKAATVTAKTGPIMAVRTLEADTSEALFISNNSQTIRVGLKDIPTLGRTTQGVRIMRLAESDAVSSLALMSEQPAEEEEGDEVDQIATTSQPD